MKYIPGKITDYIESIKRTYGNEYMTLEGSEYIGYYHIIGDDKYTGESHDKNSEKLILYNSDKNFVEYINLKELYLLEIYKEPVSYQPILIQKDYDKGYFNRYFLKKRNDISFYIVEINKKQYDSLNTEDSGINEKYYFAIELKWKLTGPGYDIYNDNNKIVTYGIIDTNRRTVYGKEKEMQNIKSYLVDYTEFARL